MAEFPHMPLATDAYLADTIHLTTLQHGIYLKLLITAWRTAGLPRLPNDDKLLARYAGLDPRTWRANRDVILAFWDLGDDGFWTQKKQLKVREIVSKKSAVAKEKAERRWADKPLKNNDTEYAEAMPEACPDDAIQNQTLLREKEEPNGSLPETSVSGVSSRKPSRRNRRSYPDDFERVWASYPTSSNMSKADAFTAWSKLDPDDRQLVEKSIPGFLAFCKANPEYQPIYFERYISKRRFEGHASPEGSTAASEDDWQKRLDWARKNHQWSTAEWGPMPGHAGCLVPKDMLQPADGAGWVEWRRSAAA